MAEEYFINGAGSGLELDDDCDFLMDDCEDDGGLREVLHMFACSTPKLSGGGGLCLTNNGSPRSLRLYSPRSGSSLGMMSFQNAGHSPGTSKTLLTTPLSSATASTSSQTSGNINLSLLSNLEQHREVSSPKRFFVAASSSSLPLPLPQGKNLPRQPLAQQHEPAKVSNY